MHRGCKTAYIYVFIWILICNDSCVVCEDFLGVDHHDFAFDLAITGLFNLSCWISRLSVLAPSLLTAFWKSRVQLEL